MMSSSKKAKSHNIATLFAPAKINLYLSVIGRRDDGYHLLDMLNATLAFGDTLNITIKEDRAISLVTLSKDGKEIRELSDPTTNLATKAFRAVCNATGKNFGADIKITKEIPVGGGLGGGSSDAAAVLRFFRDNADLLQIKITNAELLDIALSLGADVPYLLEGGFARVEGIGEKISPVSVPLLDGIECLIIVPPILISTKEIFARYQKRFPVIPKKNLLQIEEFLSKDNVEALVHNDLEEIVIEYAPMIGEILSDTRNSKDGVASISGSGSCIFVLPREGKKFRDDYMSQIEEAITGFGVKVIRTAIQERY